MAEDASAAMVCDTCYAPCHSTQCMEAHKTKRGRQSSSMCDTMLFCPNCQVKLLNYKKKDWGLNKHTCGECYCFNCKFTYHPKGEGHLCYMQTIHVTKSQEKTPCCFIFYDFESMLLNCGTHRPHLVVTQSICECCSTHESTCSTCRHHYALCKKWNDDSTHFNHPACTQCGQREVVFRGEKTVERFCSWLFSHQHRDIIAIAHNARTYDAYFLYNYLLQQSIIPNIIFKGSKIMYCHVGSSLSIQLLDSLNFFKYATLSAAQKFWTCGNEKKDISPTCITQKTITCSSQGSIRDKFLQWYKIHEEEPFDMDRQLLEYCHSYVDILLNTCWKFRKLFMAMMGPHHIIDPFDYITIVSLCMGTFHAKFLPEEWLVLYKKDARNNCMHRIWDCKCSWVNARKLHGDAPIEVYMGKGSWAEVDWDKVATHHFVKSPIGLIPPYGYA